MAEQPRKPYLDGGKSIGEMFRAHVRLLKKSNEKESQFEKPYTDAPYPKMHLMLPGVRWPSLRRPLELDNMPGSSANPIKHTYLFPPPYCTLFVSSLDCNETGRGTGSVWFTPPSTWDSGYDWKVWTDKDGTKLVNLEASGRMSEFLDFDVEILDEDLEEVTVCGEVTFSGLASTALVSYGPPGFAVQPLGSLRVPPPSFTVASSYSKGIFPCGCESRDIECGCSSATCTVTIGYTTQQMSLSGTQTLSVSGATYDSKCHTWSIQSGGGSLGSPDVDGDVVYTAPATNVNCANNPTIALSCDGVVVDTLEIAVNNSAVGGVTSWYIQSQACYWNGFEYRCHILSYYCNGSRNWGAGGYVHQASCYNLDPGSCNGYPGYHCWNNTVGAVIDHRTSSLCSQGCCPAGLL